MRKSSNYSNIKPSSHGVRFSVYGSKFLTSHPLIERLTQLVAEQKLVLLCCNCCFMLVVGRSVRLGSECITMTNQITWVGFSVCHQMLLITPVICSVLN